MSNSLFTVAKVVEAIETLSNGSKNKVLAALLPSGSLAPIGNLETNRIDLERLAGDSKFDLNYAAFQVIDNKYFYVPIEDLHNVIKRLDQKEGKVLDFNLLLKDMESVNLLKMLPIIKGFSMVKDGGFVLF